MEHPQRDFDRVSYHSTLCNRLLSVLHDFLPSFLRLVIKQLTSRITLIYYLAPLFSRVTAALTTPQSGQDIKGMFENFVKEIHSMKSRK